MSRGWSIALGSLVALALAAAVFYGPKLREGANMGAGFVAKQMCSCLFVEKRRFDACRPDLMAGTEVFRTEQVADPPGVRAHLPFVAERTALFDAELGCSLQ